MKHGHLSGSIGFLRNLYVSWHISFQRMLAIRRLAVGFRSFYTLSLWKYNPIECTANRFTISQHMNFKNALTNDRNYLRLRLMRVCRIDQESGEVHRKSAINIFGFTLVDKLFLILFISIWVRRVIWKYKNINERETNRRKGRQDNIGSPL